MENPFKFGTIVEDNYFTDRVNEVAYIRQFISGPNHLVLISPRRFGKSSVVNKALKESGREYLTLNLQRVTSVSNLAAQLLRELFKIRPLERLKHGLATFRIVPTLSTNPVTGTVDIAFQPSADGSVVLEDVMQLLDKAASDTGRLVVVLDEFQEILDIDKHLDKQLRAIMQEQQHINYILLGSQESMMEDIFEKKKSPFYHFGELMRLKKIPRPDFEAYLSDRLRQCAPGLHGELANRILDYTDCHPYYSQQLASHIWQVCCLQVETSDPMETAIMQILESHGLDYERLWMNFKRTDKWLLRTLAEGQELQTGEYKTSTMYSALKKLQKSGYVIYTTRYELEDPFFRAWIVSL